MNKSKKRVAVFIDNSNVFKHLVGLCKIDPQWCKLYDPEKLSKKLAGERTLVGIYFYCTPPPSYLLQEGPKGEKKYWTQMSYYEAIKKLPNIELKFGRLTGNKDNLNEKNLDTQLTADMIKLAAANEYDVAILVSNDGDYQSAVETVKSFGKKVEVVFFKGDASMALMRICDVTRRARRVFFMPLKFSQLSNKPK